MRFRLCLDCRHKNTLKNPENGCFLTKTTVFHGPSGETRTRGILVPKARKIFLLILSGPFPCFPLQCPVLCEPLVSTVSRCSEPVYGLICGQTLLSGQLRQFSPPPIGKLFLFYRHCTSADQVVQLVSAEQCLRNLVRWKQR